MKDSFGVVEKEWCCKDEWTPLKRFYGIIDERAIP
jgi:hypothetical protein